MFYNSIHPKQQDKVCSISNFSSSSNLNDVSLSDNVKELMQQTKKNLPQSYQKPVYIISQNFKSKHINALTQLLENHAIPLQFQSQTDSLGVELNTTFFVLVDNKNGPQTLGKQFNSSLFTVVGYPKKGPNKKNIYCQTPDQVLEAYKQFSNPKIQHEKKLQEKHSQINTNQSMLKSGSNAFSMLTAESKGIKLKSVSKYDKKTRQKSLNKETLKGKLSKKTQNKENLTSIRSIMKNKENHHNLYFIESSSDSVYNSLIERLHKQIKSSNKQTEDKSVMYNISQNDVIKRLNEFFDNQENQKAKKRNVLGISQKKINFIVLNHDMALKMATRVQSQFYSYKSRIQFIVIMLPKQNSFDNQYFEKQMLVVKKSIHSQLFHNVICTPQQCEKVLKTLGFIHKYEKDRKLVQLSLSNDSFEQKDKSFDQISFCPQKKFLNNVKSQKSLKGQSKQVSFKKVQYGRQSSSESYQNQYQQNIPITKISPPKQQSSSAKSKIKLIKIIKKTPSNINPSTLDTKSKEISQVNSQYCINKNKSIVEKLQSKIQQKRSLSSQKSSSSLTKNRSTHRFNTIKNGSSTQSDGSQSQLSSSKIFQKQQKSLNKNNWLSSSNEYKLTTQRSKKVKKLMTMPKQEPFVVQCSQVFFSQDSNMQEPRERKNSDKNKTSTPFSADQYYFGSSINQQNKNQRKNSKINNTESTIDGLLYIQYNELVQSVANLFKDDCPQKIINKNNIKPYYLAVEYSRQLKKIWRNDRLRKVMTLLTDIQGLTEIQKYYSDVMYEQDQLQFSSVVQSNINSQRQEYAQKNQNYSVFHNHSKNEPELLLFYILISEKQVNSPIFQEFSKLSSRIPKHQLIKFIIPQNLSDNQMKQKSLQIYQQMINYFQEISQDHGDKFVQTI